MNRLILSVIAASLPVSLMAQETIDETSSAAGLAMGFSANFADLPRSDYFPKGEDKVYDLNPGKLSQIDTITVLPSEEGVFSPFALMSTPAFDTVASDIVIWEWEGTYKLTEDGPAFFTFSSSFYECSIEYILNGVKEIAFGNVPNGSRNKHENTTPLPTAAIGDEMAVKVTAVCDARRLNSYDDDGFSFEVLYPSKNLRLIAENFMSRKG